MNESMYIQICNCNIPCPVHDDPVTFETASTSSWNKEKCGACEWRESEAGYYSPCPEHSSSQAPIKDKLQ